MAYPCGMDLPRKSLCTSLRSFVIDLLKIWILFRNEDMDGFECVVKSKKICLWHCWWRLVVHFCFIGVSGVCSFFALHRSCCMSKWRMEGLGRPFYLSISAHVFMCHTSENL
jgi:hypothetical protein